MADILGPYYEANPLSGMAIGSGVVDVFMNVFGGSADTLPFDPTLPYEGVGNNRGCPPGYFCQYVAPGDVDASQPANIGIVPGGSTAVRCRKIEGYTPAINAAETGQAAADSWLNAVNTVGEVASEATNVFGAGLATILPWILLAGGAYLFIITKASGRRF